MMQCVESNFDIIAFLGHTFGGDDFFVLIKYPTSLSVYFVATGITSDISRHEHECSNGWAQIVSNENTF